MRDDLNNQKVQDSIVVLLLGLALGAYSLIGFFTAAVQTKWIMSPYLFPLLLSAFAVLLAAALFGEGHREARLTRAGETPAKPAALKMKNALAVVLLGMVYAALLPLIRFIPATLLFLAALMWLMGEHRPWMIAAVALLVPLALYALFGLGLGVRLP